MKWIRLYGTGNVERVAPEVVRTVMDSAPTDRKSDWIMMTDEEYDQYLETHKQVIAQTKNDRQYVVGEVPTYSDLPPLESIQDGYVVRVRDTSGTLVVRKSGYYEAANGRWNYYGEDLTTAEPEDEKIWDKTIRSIKGLFK